MIFFPTTLLILISSETVLCSLCVVSRFVWFWDDAWLHFIIPFSDELRCRNSLPCVALQSQALVYPSSHAFALPVSHRISISVSYFKCIVVDAYQQVIPWPSSLLHYSSCRLGQEELIHIYSSSRPLVYFINSSPSSASKPLRPPSLFLHFFCTFFINCQFINTLSWNWRCCRLWAE